MADETRATLKSSLRRRPARSRRTASVFSSRRTGGGREGGGPGGRKYFRRKKVCKFCVEKIEAINYKDIRLLAQFVAESGRIVPAASDRRMHTASAALVFGDQAGA